jgi:hypothetical protein
MRIWGGKERKKRIEERMKSQKDTGEKERMKSQKDTGEKEK